MLHRVQIGPLLPMTQGVRILTPCQDLRWVGSDHLFHVNLRVGGLGIRHDVDPAAKFDGLSWPGIATDAGERRVPELVEHLDAGWLAIALLQGMQTRQIAISGFVGTFLNTKQFAQRPHLGRQRGKIGGFRVEHRDTQLFQRCQHARLGRAPAQDQVRFLCQQGLDIDAAIIGHLGFVFHLGGIVGGIVDGDQLVTGTDVVKQFGKMGYHAHHPARSGCLQRSGQPGKQHAGQPDRQSQPSNHEITPPQ